MRVLGMDPALRNMGYGILDVSGSRFAVVDCGVIRNPPKRPQSECLVHLHRELRALIEQYKPEVAAVEGVIYLQNYQTAITLGAARGVLLLACAQIGLPIFEYAPRRIKAAATGRGGARKAQVAFMIRSMLGLNFTPLPDAADALAVAMTHAQHAHKKLPVTTPRL